ncbi:MAG TPA: RNA polymerase sigma factor [Vicinamibacterales bacterium]|nr:RNA polymerase sigma factor [Vicinamibacterales bacterium]
MADSDDREPSDDALIARAAAGDRDAFAALYRRRRPDVYRFALLMSGSPAVADDVTQDVFMEVIHHANRYQPDRSGLLPWLFGIARNHVLRSRYRQRFSVPMGETDASTPQLMVTSDPLAGIARRQHVAALRRALMGMPVKYRETIVLCDLQEMSYADAAASLGCAIGTVRSRLHRGRSLLAARLSASSAAPLRSPIARWIV